MNEKSGLKAQY